MTAPLPMSAKWHRGPTDDPPQRLYGNDLEWDKKATHLDDVNSFFPLRCLEALV